MGQVGTGKSGRWVIAAFELLTAGTLFGQFVPTAESNSTQLATQTFIVTPSGADMALIPAGEFNRQGIRSQRLAFA